MEVRRSPLALAVLCLLEVGPLHPYGLQRLIRRWGKDQVINVEQRASLYKTIQRLLAAGLIAVHTTERDQQFPERTVYELTGEGRRVEREWLAAMVAEPRNEYPEFPAALSFLMLLGPDEARAVLERRGAALRPRLEAVERGLAGEWGELPRVTLLESEYERAVLAAELAWLDALVADLATGALSWSHDELAEAAQASLAEG